MQQIIGQKIKELRTARKMTLKELSEKTGLSGGFLSQVERGLSSLGLVSMKSIADTLGVDLSHFFVTVDNCPCSVMRSYEQKVFRVDEADCTFASLAGPLEDKKLDPMIVTIPPDQSPEQIVAYSHPGEEFVYVLEGTLTAFIGEKEYRLYPGDSLHVSCLTPHNWGNFTNKIVKILTVVTPSILRQPAAGNNPTM